MKDIIKVRLKISKVDRLKSKGKKVLLLEIINKID